MRIFLLCWISACAIATSCRSNDQEDDKKNAIKINDKKFDSSAMKTDALFAVNAMDAGLLEAKMGELAQTYGTTPSVKQLGKLMSADHTQLNKELSLAAWKNNITVPGFLSPASKKKYTALMKIDGAAFDQAYLKMIIETQQADLKDFEKEKQSGTNADIEDWINRATPVLQHHIAISDSLLNKIPDDNGKPKTKSPDKLISLNELK